MKYFIYTLFLIGGYLMGSIPTAYIMVKRRTGIDLREHGSRSIGAMNLQSVLGWGLAVRTVVYDGLKGAIPVILGYVGNYYLGLGGLHYIAGLGAVWGHNFSVYLRFWGGRGVATAGGSLLALNFIAFWIIYAVLAGVRFTSKHSSIANLTLAIMIAPTLWIVDELVFGVRSVFFQLLYGVGVCFAIVLSYIRNPDKPFVEVEWE